MIDIEYIVIDPIMGEVSVGETPDEALDYACRVNGKAFAVTWQNGKSVKREAL